MNKSIIVKSEKKILYYKDLLDNCVIGLSTVMLKKKTIPHNLFSNLNTQEDLDAWLKLTKKKINAYFFDDILTCWNSTPQSLSKNTFQKIQDLWKVLNNQTNLKKIKKILIFINLSLNAVKRKF